MATVSSSRGVTEVINARRTESSDAPAIHELIAHRTTNQFGHVNVVHLIEKANLSVTLNNQENQILGFAGFLDHPPTEVCDSGNWESWMSELKLDVASTASPLNSLFLHLFVAKEDYTIGCASEIVRTVFNAVPELRYLFVCLRNDAQLEQALKQIFTPVERKTTGGGVHHTLYVCHRHNHVPQLHIRRAVVEDHDDVIPIFKRLKNNLTEVYGNYFLAEMVEAQDENNFCLVAEAGGKAIGFMSICSEVNVEFLQDTYELDSFNGLRKPHPDDVLEKPESEKDESEEEGTAAVTVNSEEREGEDNGTQTFLPDVEPVPDQPKPVIEECEDEIEESDNDEASPSQASGLSPNPVIILTTPKLSELHMKSDSISFTRLDTSRIIDDADMSLVEPKPMEPAKKKFTPTYYGESNVFSIQLFCISEQYEMRSADFLPEIFKLIPHKDIAIMTTPHLVPEFPLLQQFVRITPKPGVNAPHELYAFHRHGLLSSEFTVRKACTSDFEQVEALVGNVMMKENLLKDLQLFNSARRDADGTAIQAFVADCLDQVVGVCVIRSEEDIEFIRSHYNVEDFIYFNHHRRDEHGHLHHFAMNPIFQHFSKHFLKEVLRQSYKSCLYYSIYPENCDSTLTKHFSLATSLNFLVPVRARKQIDYPLDELNINAPAERIVATPPSFALTHINRKLTLEPKVTINARIVVVGASETGISFLENLCFCPHLRFNNLTLISKRGLPQSLGSLTCTYSADEMAQLSLRSWVNVVTGFMVGIDRSRQEAIMADDTRVAYDHLILCTGQQFQIPSANEAYAENNGLNIDIKESDIIRPHSIDSPAFENVLALNDETDYATMTRWASKLAEKVSDSDTMARLTSAISEKLPRNAPADVPYVIVYGRTVEAYITVQRLLSLGIPGRNIALVKPPGNVTSLAVCDDGCEGDPFNEPAVTDAVMANLKSAKVEILNDYILVNWNSESTAGGTRVYSVSVTSSDKPLRHLPCLGFLSFHPRRIDQRMFLAANDSCLVFDGRLSIDADFKTNDPRIRAAGPLTKYTRRYYADSVDYRHENQSAKEIGFRLAMNILPLFDPTLDDNVEMSNAIPPTPGPASKRALSAVSSIEENPHDKLVPVYMEPKVTYGVLPGGLDYLHIRKPGRRIKYDVQLSDSDHGKELVTGSVESGNYFRLHVNQYRSVETVTCLVRPEKVKIPVANFLRLYGLHERYLNSLVSRYDEGLISDFYLYFRDPWATAIFHDRFQDFRQEIRDLLCTAPTGAKNVLSVESYVRQMADEDMALSEEQRQALFDHYEQTGRRHNVDDRLLSYLSYNYYHLPMYAKPGMI